jgi:hypothetical protein
MTEYLIAFNEEWVPEHTEEQLQEKSRALVQSAEAVGGTDEGCRRPDLHRWPR